MFAYSSYSSIHGKTLHETSGIHTGFLNLLLFKYLTIKTFDLNKVFNKKHFNKHLIFKE